MRISLELDPNQVPWLQVLLRSFTMLQPGVTPDSAETQSNPFHTTFEHITETAQTVLDQINEQLQGDNPL
jgi:hypothetical protein